MFTIQSASNKVKYEITKPTGTNNDNTQCIIIYLSRIYLAHVVHIELHKRHKYINNPRSCINI